MSGQESNRRLVVAAGVAGILVVILALVVWSTMGRSRGGEPMAALDFVDEGTGEFSKHGVDEIPPLMGKGGEASVVRVVWNQPYSAPPATEKVKYLLKYDTGAKASLTEAMRSVLPSNRQAVLDHMTDEMLVRNPKGDSTWVRINTTEGQAVVR